MMLVQSCGEETRIYITTLLTTHLILDLHNCLISEQLIIPGNELNVVNYNHLREKQSILQ